MSDGEASPATGSRGLAAPVGMDHEAVAAFEALLRLLRAGRGGKLSIHVGEQASGSRGPPGRDRFGRSRSLLVPRRARRGLPAHPRSARSGWRLLAGLPGRRGCGLRHPGRAATRGSAIRSGQFVPFLIFGFELPPRLAKSFEAVVDRGLSGSFIRFCLEGSAIDECPRPEIGGCQGGWSTGPDQRQHLTPETRPRTSPSPTVGRWVGFPAPATEIRPTREAGPIASIGWVGETRRGTGN